MINTSIRKKLYFIHKWLSLIFAIPFILLALSGLVIAFRPKPSTLDVKNPVSLVEVLKKLKKEREDWSFPRVNYTNDYFVVYAKKLSELKLLTIERESGNIIKEEYADRNFYFSFQTLHESLFLEDSGRLIVGLSGWALIIVLITGLVFWLKNKFMSQIIRLYKNGSLLRMKDLHLLMGVSILCPLIFAGITGFLIHYNSYFYSDGLSRHHSDPLPCTFSQQIQFLEGLKLGKEGVYKACGPDRPYFTIVNDAGIMQMSVKKDLLLNVPRENWKDSEYLRAQHFNRLHSGDFFLELRSFYNVVIGGGLLMLTITGLFIWKRKQLIR